MKKFWEGENFQDLPDVPDREVVDLIKSVPTHFSANTVVELGNTCDYHTSLVVLSGATVLVGAIADLLHANHNTNVFIAGTFSGIMPLYIQTSDTTASGNFTDPTSGLPSNAFPVQERVASGGMLWANSGLYGSGAMSPAAPINSAPTMCSGGIQFASFQRPHRYARLIYSGAALACDAIYAGFVGNKHTTASGGGQTQSPGSGAVNV